MNSFRFLSRKTIRITPRRSYFSTNASTASAPSTGFSWLIENHGGKVGLAAIALGGGLIWSYFEGGSQRTKLETTLENNFVLEPYETLLARYTNNFPLEKLDDLILNEFHDDIMGKKFIDYQDFVSRLEDKCKINLKNGYLMERALASYIERCERIEKETIEGRINPPPAGWDLLFTSSPYPTGLNLDNNFQYVSNYNKDSSRSLKDLSFDVVFLLSLLSHFTELIPVSDDKDKLKVIERANIFIKMIKIKEGVSDDTLTKDQVASLLGYLEATSQLPAEFQASETETSWPYRTYRQKTSQEIITKREKEIDLKQSKEQWSDAEVQDLLKSLSCCAWGSCYNLNEF